MKLLTAAQVKEWDQYTILHEPVSSLALMERAAKACVSWILKNVPTPTFYIFCGKGNNGGDGLAIARLLQDAKCTVSVYILETETKASEDFTANYNLLFEASSGAINSIYSKDDFPIINNDAYIIDALFGTGLNRKLTGIAAELVMYINNSGEPIIAIDMPSGMPADQSCIDFTVIKAAYTLTFECHKLALLMPENADKFGEVHVLDINLHPDFLLQIESDYELIDETLYQQLYKPRKPFAHKGNYGHALLIAGSYGKMGAAVLSAKACLHSGVGLLTCHVPECGLDIMQISAPEAMCEIDEQRKIVSTIKYDLKKYSAMGIGPGIGTQPKTKELLNFVLQNYSKPIVIDADALNIISQQKDWLHLLPQNSILTPHPKEFARLFGDNLNDFEKIKLAVQKARELNIIIVLKGHHTFIATPDGKGYFNTTGNAGMAKGGSGDVLTGLLTGLLAQDYSPAHAAVIGVYLHGRAGDRAAEKYGLDGVVSGDLVEGVTPQ